jgi:predicted regulator of Ras-like GTPase activity (Roadblock/LC7/MglB family)
MSTPYSSPRCHPVALSQEASTFNWLPDSFTTKTGGVVEAVAVSSDGLLMAMSAVKDWANAERLAAVVSGMTSLAGGAAASYRLGHLNRVVIDTLFANRAGDVLTPVLIVELKNAVQQ